MSPPKIKVATCSLAGCFGCHMSFLDMDERLATLVEHIEFRRSPLTDIKNHEPCDIGLIEGGLCNTENVETLHEFRQHCRILVAVGACAINGGVPAMRNGLDVRQCLVESYLDGIGVVAPKIPDDPELPRLLEKVHPLHEAVKIDYFLAGCPPPADAFLELITAIREQREPQYALQNRRFD